MTKGTLLEMLNSHDWYYERSDDHSVWQQGALDSKQMTRAFDKAFKEEPELVIEVCKEFLKTFDTHGRTPSRPAYAFVFSYLLQENKQLDLNI